MAWSAWPRHSVAAWPDGLSCSRRTRNSRLLPAARVSTPHLRPRLDDLRALAHVWAAYLDQDGAEPSESRVLRKRGVTVGRRGEDGLVPVRGNLLPEVAAQLQLGFDSVLNPRVDEVTGPCFTAGDQDDRDEPIDARRISGLTRKGSTTRWRCC